MPENSSPTYGRRHALERVRDHENILLEFARVSAEATDLQRLLEIACHHTARATGVQHSKILRYRSDKGDLKLVAGTGWNPGLVGHSRTPADMISTAGRAYQTGQVVRVGNLIDHPEFRRESIFVDHGIVSVVNAPVPIGAAVWGIVEVDSTEKDAFSEDDERFLETFGYILSLGIRHRLAQEQREHDAEETARRLVQIETFMQEQNHRVRNYFQMILAILSTRSTRTANAEVRKDFAEVMNRITAIGLAHDLLRIESGRSFVDAAVYLDALCSGIERTLEDELRIERDLEPVSLRADRAVPLGLVLNELITNSLKYAVAGRKDGFIGIRFRSDIGTREAMLVVRDNGPGMGEQRPGSMGLKLVHSLATQLSGRVNINSNPSGTIVTIVFPLVE